MAVKDDALTTQANFKTAHGVSGTDDDALIDSLIDRATDWIESMTDRKLKARNYNGYSTKFDHAETGDAQEITSENYILFDGQDAVKDSRSLSRIYLPQYPIVYPDSVDDGGHANALAVVVERLTDRGSSVSGGEDWDALTEWDDYIIEYQKGEIRLVGSTLLTGTRNYRITCTAGYTTGHISGSQPYVPDDLEQLCLYIAGRLYKEDFNVTSEKIGTWSRTYAGSRDNGMSILQSDPIISVGLAKYRKITL